MNIQTPHAAVARNRVAAGGSSSLLTDLLEWWDLDESSGNALSAGGSGNHDLTDNNTVTANATGAPDGGSCRVFTSANDEYFTSAAGNIWNTGTNMSFAVWTNVTADTSNKAVCGHQASAGQTTFYINSLEWPVVQFDGTTSLQQNTASSGWDCWVVTSTGPGGSDELFKNGSSVDTGTSGWEPGSAVFYLGKNYTGTLWPFAGEMVSCAIWDKVLSASEITEFYNSGTNLRFSDL